MGNVPLLCFDCQRVPTLLGIIEGWSCDVIASGKYTKYYLDYFIGNDSGHNISKLFKTIKRGYNQL